MEKPRVRCLVAKPTGSDGDVLLSELVDLADAEEKMREGYYVVGPDPHDMDALAQWERDYGGTQ